MYPYGESAGDTEFSFTERQCPKMYIPGGGIRFFSKRFREFFVSIILASLNLDLNTRNFQSLNFIIIPVRHN